jgi:ammonium transporter, Amt family
MPWAALVVGAAAGALCYWAVQLKYRLRYDDALDVVGAFWLSQSGTD